MRHAEKKKVSQPAKSTHQPDHSSISYDTPVDLVKAERKVFFGKESDDGQAKEKIQTTRLDTPPGMPPAKQSTERPPRISLQLRP
jgi:hypothetical protein